MRSIAIAALCVAVLGFLAPMALADGRNPGSALIYPVHRSGGGFFTVVCVTNTNLQPAVGGIQLGGTTGVHFEYVNVVPNPADAFKPLNCVIFNRRETLTPADTLCVLTGCHNAAAAQGQEGYLVVSAEDPQAFDQIWDFDSLIGSELVVNATGIMYSVNAFSAEFVGGDNGNGRLDFDGAEYEELPDVLYIDSFVALAGSSLTLINLTGGDDDCNTVLFSVFNDNEFPLSTTLTFSCWFDQPLTAISPLFSEGFLAGLPNDAGELDTDCDGVGDIESGWAIVDSIDVSQPGGTNIDDDGAMLGAITAGATASINGGHLLWESTDKQGNGVFLAP